MKNRFGFVSNSSSSSFIIGFDKKPRGVEELKNIVFSDGRHSIVSDYGPDHISVWEAAERIFSDISKAEPLKTKNDILKEIMRGYFETYPSRDFSIPTESRYIENDFQSKFGRAIQSDPRNDEWYNKWLSALDKENDQRDKEIERCARLYLDSIYHIFKDKIVFSVEYGDENPGESLLEHGDIFRQIPHIVISHH